MVCLTILQKATNHDAATPATPAHLLPSHHTYKLPPITVLPVAINTEGGVSLRRWEKGSSPKKPIAPHTFPPVQHDNVDNDTNCWALLHHQHPQYAIKNEHRLHGYYFVIVFLLPIPHTLTIPMPISYLTSHLQDNLKQYHSKLPTMILSLTTSALSQPALTVNF